MCEPGCRPRQRLKWNNVDDCESTWVDSTLKQPSWCLNVIQTHCSATVESDLSSSTAPRTSSSSIDTGPASRRSSSITSTAAGYVDHPTFQTTSSSMNCSSISWSPTWWKSTSDPRVTLPRWFICRRTWRCGGCGCSSSTRRRRGRRSSLPFCRSSLPLSQSFSSASRRYPSSPWRTA